VVRGSVASEHLIHLFDETQSLVDTVSTYLFEAWQRGDALLIAIRPGNWALTCNELQARGCPVGALTARGQLVVLDAATTLATFLVDGEPERDRFLDSVGSIVKRVCGDEKPCGLTVYGEMVDILAAQGNFIAAERLEALWNELAAQYSFRLLCGYSSAHFGSERNARHLEALCQQHTGSGAASSDLLASWLLAERRAKFHLHVR
jgi:hypothetical protein